VVGPAAQGLEGNHGKGADDNATDEVNGEIEGLTQDHVRLLSCLARANLAARARPTPIAAPLAKPAVATRYDKIMI
jgi:hypothetical protein